MRTKLYGTTPLHVFSATMIAVLLAAVAVAEAARVAVEKYLDTDTDSNNE
jgi:hypothetical protein